jgi:hypothetical protein
MHEFEELIVWLDEETRKVPIVRRTVPKQKGFLN